MPDILDATGLTVKTRDELVTELNTGITAIYGADANIDQNSPDGQVIGIVAQQGVDNRELAVQINNGFDPDRAVGRVLDERVTINNIERAGGTFTTINITLVVDRTLTLQGLDDSYPDINGTGFTVQDNAGTQFILVDTVTLIAGTYSLLFRAKAIGRIETIIGTITNAVTVVLGVSSVNNPTAPVSFGQNEETDAQLRVRRQRSTSISSNGYLNGLLGLVLTIDGVTDAKLYENYKNVTDSDGIPPHCIWLIADGGSNQEIGEAMYARKSYGCDMLGDVVVNITTASGSLFTAQFDRPISQNLYIKFQIKRTDPIHGFDLDIIKNYIADNVAYTIGSYAETSLLTQAARDGIAAQGGGGVPINMEISDDNAAWVDYLDVPSLSSKWVIDAVNITVTVI
jgi:uncharacterized phage protein gp47/JayE